jgi:hypothetical protein
MAKTTDGDGGGEDGGKGDNKNGCDSDSDGMGHRQQSTKTTAKEMVVAAAAAAVAVVVAVVATETAEAMSCWRGWLKAEAIVVVETVDAEVSAAATWTPLLRFIRCWLVGARREGLLKSKF